MSPFTAEELEPGTSPYFIDQDSTAPWVPVASHGCDFTPEIFLRVMVNLIKNPNINSNWLFRADILYDDSSGDLVSEPLQDQDRPRGHDLTGFHRQRTLVRRLIPRNEKRDNPLNQTCTFHQSVMSPTDTSQQDKISTVVIYIPHLECPSETPFYHPVVAGIAHMHTYSPHRPDTGIISVHYLPHPTLPPVHQTSKLVRTAQSLLYILYRHGTGQAAGYTKRVHHDQVIPQQRVQDRYADLKRKYARELVDGWQENTDSSKHVFEDLGIAAFLIELWIDFYHLSPGKETGPKPWQEDFSGFVDVGCGNGLLVYILNREGFTGWGFDARSRKSWPTYSLPSSASPGGSNLEQRLLLPSVIPQPADSPLPESQVHDGVFPKDVFIISNHADELTPWTPILSIQSGEHANPFIVIPCCSHSLTGARYRAPPPRNLPRNVGKGKSAYASLVDWTEQIAEDCGWNVEREMLRIPSTRNTCLVGRRRTEASGPGDVDLEALISKYGGVGGYFENVAKLVKSAPRGH